jgi:hypothetical protein
MPTLLKRIHVAIGTGAALWLGGGGCYDAHQRAATDTPDARVDSIDAAVDAMTRPHDASSDVAVIPDATRDAVAVVDSGTYDTSRLGCSGPFYDEGYYGQCCVVALCYTPDNGRDCLAANDPNLVDTVPRFPPGSGDCTCSEAEPEVTGPFARNPDHANEPPGSCCYLVGSIGCTGRPLCVHGEQVVASVVRRNDWILAGA